MRHAYLVVYLDDKRVVDVKILSEPTPEVKESSQAGKHPWTVAVKQAEGTTYEEAVANLVKKLTM